jgi:hypothetical protein
MFFVLMLILVTTLGGFALTYLYDREAPLPIRFASGLMIGMAIQGLNGYALANGLGLSPVMVAVAALPLLSPLMLFRYPEIRERLRQDIVRMRPRLRSAAHRTYYVVWTVSALLLVIVFLGAVYQKDGAIYTTNHYNHGDLPFHLSITQGFVVGENYPTEHPEKAGARLTYHFLSDFVAAQYVAIGGELIAVYQLQNVLMVLALLTILHWWGLKFTRNRFAMLIVPALLLLNGGWGWLKLIEVSRLSGTPLLSLFLHPTIDATTGQEGIRFSNIITTLLMTQRGILMALPLAVLAFTCLWRGFRKDDFERLPWMLGAGFLAGLLPLAHGHSFLVQMLVGTVLACFDIPHAKSRWRGWLAYFGLALLIALPQVVLLRYKTSVLPGSFFGTEMGWDSNARDFLSWLTFWYRNSGIIFVLLGLAYLWRSKPDSGAPWRGIISARHKQFVLPFLLCFVLANSVRLAPWIWDNIKVLFYFLVGALPLIALLLGIFWRRGGFGWFMAPFLFLLLIVSGGLDVYRIGSGQTAGEVFSKEAIAFARIVQEKTAPRDYIMTAPLHTHPVMLSGRRVISGYGGHLWSHGLEFADTEAEIRRIYAGEPDAAALLKKHRIAYITVGPPERDNRDIRLNESYLSRFPVVGEVGAYRLLKVAP